MRKLGIFLLSLLTIQGIYAEDEEYDNSVNSIDRQMIGIGGSYRTSLYKRKDRFTLPILLLDLHYTPWANEVVATEFFIKDGLIFGYRILGYSDTNERFPILSIYGNPLGGYSVKGKQMNEGYKSIDKRGHMFMVGIDLGFNSFPKFSFEKGKKGSKFGIEAKKSFNITDKFILIPGMNYTYLSSKFVNNYFGVQSHELGGLIRETYRGKSTHVYEINLEAKYLFNKHFELFGYAGLAKVTSGISNSPIVDRSFISIYGAGIRYTF